MITEVHAITGFAHIKVKQTDINKWCYIRKHAFRQSCLMMFLVKRAIPLSNEGRAEARGFLPPAPDGNAVSSVSLRPLDRTTVCCTQAESCTDTPPAGGTCVRLLLEMSICASDLSPLQRKLIRLDAPPFEAPLLWSIPSLKLQKKKKKKVNVLILFFPQTTSIDVKITFYPV